MFKRIGVHLDRTNLANWMIKMGDLVHPLIDHMLKHLQQQPIIHMDESTLQVLNEPGKAAQSKSYMWLIATFGSHPILLYRYDASRSQKTPNNLLTEQIQALMVDGYDGYQPACQAYQIQRLGCWAHAWRKFVDVQKAQPKGKTGKADQAIAKIQKLYRIEAQSKDDPPDKRYQQRQEQVKTIRRINATNNDKNRPSRSSKNCTRGWRKV
jgi:transposase